MALLNVNAKTKEYPIYIEKDFSGLKACIEKSGLLKAKMLIVTDSNVEKLYLADLKEVLKDIEENICVHIFSAGEENKTLDTIKGIYESCISNKLDRGSAIIALGGGVCGDMAGFAAATYMRGIKFIQIPTTLLSQVDSSVGGKTGVDFAGGKNIIGAFYQPEFVYANVSTIETLPCDEFISGMGEVIKHGLIMDKAYFDYIFKNKESIKERKKDTLSYIIEGSCEIKAKVVAQDETEQGLREILNFGHTAGHAIESLSGYTIPHGKCVALGMICALNLSLKYGNIKKEDIEEVKALLSYFDFPSKVSGIASKSIYDHMFYDKKARNNVLTFVILSEMGKAVSTKAVTKEDIFAALEEIIEFS